MIARAKGFVARFRTGEGSARRRCAGSAPVWANIRTLPLDANEIAIVRRAGLAGLGVHRREGPALPKSAERGNLSLTGPSSGGRAAAGALDARGFL
ncbi:MAG: hypothetical protein ACREDJ_00440 [Methylocella sp.]